MTPLPLVDARGISKSYPQGSLLVHALRDASLSFGRGEMIALTGPSGSGKSTLLSILGLITSPSSGVLLLEGIDASHLDEAARAERRRSSLGFVFQHFNLLPSMNAQENVALALLLNRTPWAEAMRRAAESLSGVGLGDRLSHLPSQLSGGEMQRVAIARALVHSPRMLLADEPTGNLDSKSGERILELLTEVAQKGTTVVMATHSQEALRYCSRVIALRDGVIQ